MMTNHKVDRIAGLQILNQSNIRVDLRFCEWLPLCSSNIFDTDRNMIEANNTQDFTKQIRENKQSNLIRDDIKQLVFLKQKYWVGI